MPETDDDRQVYAGARTIPENLPQILRGVAQSLREAGCDSHEIKLALLALCGVQCEAVDFFRLRARI